MSDIEFREALSRLVSAIEDEYEFDKLCAWTNKSLMDAKALLARPEPEPSDELERLQFLADRLSWPQPIRADLDAAAQTIEAFIQLRKSEPSPRITREEAYNLLDEYAAAKRDFDNGCCVKEYEAATAACLAVMGVDHEAR